MLIISECMLVPLSGSIDFRTVPLLKEHLDRLDKAKVKRIVLDFKDVTYLDSSGLALILNKFKEIQRRGGNLTLYNVGPEILHKLRIGRLVDIISTTPIKASTEIKPLSKGALPLNRLALCVGEKNLEDARAELRQLFETLPIEGEGVYDLTLAAGEAMGNFILHTPAKGGFITVEIFDDRIIIEAVDDGPGYELADDESPTTTLEHGRGIKIMRMLCDQVKIKRKTHGEGTIVKMVKLFPELG